MVISTSITVVSWALTERDSSILAAITFLSLDMLTVVPRSGDTATDWVRTSLGAEKVCAAADAATWVGRDTAAITSSFRILPPTPVPLTRERSTPFSLASFLTIGVT